MSRKRNRARKKRLSFQSSKLEQAVVNEAEGRGLVNLVYEQIGKLIKSHGQSSSKVLCGYSIAPMYVSENYDTVLSLCALDENVKCEYSVPVESEYVCEECPVYYNKVIDKKW